MAKMPSRPGVRFFDHHLLDDHGERWDLDRDLDSRAEIEGLLDAGAVLLLHAARGPVARAMPQEAAQWWRTHRMEVLDENETAELDDPDWKPQLYRNGASNLVVLTSWCVTDDQINFR